MPGTSHIAICDVAGRERRRWGNRCETITIPAQRQRARCALSQYGRQMRERPRLSRPPEREGRRRENGRATVAIPAQRQRARCAFPSTGATSAAVAARVDARPPFAARTVRAIPPRGWAMDEAVATFPIRDGFRQLALRGQVARDVTVIRRIVMKPRRAFPWIENDDGFLEVPADNVHRRNEVGVSAHENENVRPVIESVKEHCRGDVHVRPLFFKLHNLYQSVFCRGTCLTFRFMHGHPYGVLAVEALDDLDIRESGKGLKIDLLAVKRGDVMRICLHWGREVLDRDQVMVVAEELPDKENGIEPLIRRSFEKAVVEIVTVYVCKCSFHGALETARALTLRPRLCTA